MHYSTISIYWFSPSIVEPNSKIHFFIHLYNQRFDHMIGIVDKNSSREIQYRKNMWWIHIHSCPSTIHCTPKEFRYPRMSQSNCHNGCHRQCFFFCNHHWNGKLISLLERKISRKFATSSQTMNVWDFNNKILIRFWSLLKAEHCAWR